MNEPERATRVRSERSVIAFLAFVGILMAFGIDAALPAFDELRADFDLDARGLSPAITGTAYFVGMAVGQLLAGVLADRFGRRPILMVGIGIYAFGALAAAVSPNLELLLLARFVWGVGASAPLVLRMAIARDLFEGDRMARVVSTVSAVFLLGPIIVPFFGEALLLVGTWRIVFAASLMLAAVSFVWTVRFGETLDPELRRTLRVAPFVEAVGAVLRTSQTRWSILAVTFYSGAFFVWLGSAQPVLDEVYGRDSQFTIFFGVSGVGMAVALLLNNRLIDRFGTRTMVRRAAAGFLSISIVGLAIAIGADGVPSLWLWFGWAILANACNMVLGPMNSAIALEPMGDKAGMASAVLGVGQMGGGAIFAALVDSQIDGTVTPMILGSVVFGTLGLVCVHLAVRVGPAPTRETVSVNSSR